MGASCVFLEYQPGDKCVIKDLNIEGTINRISIFHDSIQYEVRFWVEGRFDFVYFHTTDLSCPPNRHSTKELACKG
jgi:hypothetical protein